MKPILIAGSIIVSLALISYSIGVFKERKTKSITKTILAFLSIGLFFDVTATCCMIIGSSNSPFTFHGFIGYTGLRIYATIRPFTVLGRAGYDGLTAC